MQNVVSIYCTSFSSDLNKDCLALEEDISTISTSTTDVLFEYEHANKTAVANHL